MKTKCILTLALAAIFFGANASADNYNVRRATFKFTVTYEGDRNRKETSKGYTDKSKFMTEKFSNKQILRALLDTPVGIAMGGSIKGWSIVFIKDGDENDGTAALRKKGEDFINISEYIEAYTEWDDYIEQYNEKETTGKKFSGRYDYIDAEGIASFEINDFYVSVFGRWSESWYYKINYVKQTYVSTVGGAKLRDGTGAASFDGDFVAVAKGTFSSGKGKLIELPDGFFID